MFISINIGRQLLKQFVTRNLLALNTTVSCTLLGVGDILQQAISNKRSNAGNRHDWIRTARIASMGLLIGPMSHQWYRLLDLKFPGSGARVCVKKVLCDMLSCPIFSFTFVVGVGLLEGKGIQQPLKEYKEKFWAIYGLDWLTNPPGQFINFAFVPPHARVVFNNSVQLLYNCLLAEVLKTDMNYMPYNFKALSMKRYVALVSQDWPDPAEFRHFCNFI